MSVVESAEPEWIELETVHAAHSRSLAEHGGAEGVRDHGLLESAMERPRNRFAYEGVSDPVELAATYMVGLAKNHPFVDGNKRTAFIAGGAFLIINGFRLMAEEADATVTMMGVAAGAINEGALAGWIRSKTVSI